MMINQEGGIMAPPKLEKLPYYIVDVFAEKKYAGNQLAVVMCAKDIPDDLKQRIAREMNFSETTFILSDKKENNGYNVRIFTPTQELSFAGHPTLGTAFIIQQEFIKNPVKDVILNLKVGQIPVAIDYERRVPDILWMHQIAPVFGETFERKGMSEVLNLEENEIDSSNPIQDVSTGVHFVIVPLRSIESLKKARIQREKYFDLIMRKEAKGILIFCPEAHEKGNNMSVRVFVDYYGIPEDPATGSGNGCLAAYLVKHRYYQRGDINIRVEQGYEIGRPSLLLLRAQDFVEKIDVYVGGKVIMVAKGELLF
jgi:trans-2,3-dihydro-3-hydroxyanthranilate isomerase